MIEKDPLSYPLITYAWVFLLSMVGGVVSFNTKIRNGHARPFNFMELIGEIMTSAFVGVITFWLCEAANVPALVSAAMVGISGHMGSRAIFFLERWATNKLPLRDDEPKL
jgi:hypothetical protein